MNAASVTIIKTTVKTEIGPNRVRESISEIKSTQRLGVTTVESKSSTDDVDGHV